MIPRAVLFILSLGGLSNQQSAKRAVWYGIVGMGVAVFATVFGPGVSNVVLILIAIAAGDSHSLAIRREGTVWAWVDNITGQLGDCNVTDTIRELGRVKCGASE